MENSSSKKEKLKILAAGDIHGNSEVSKKLAEKAEKEHVDLVILTGDLTGLTQTKNIIQPFLDRHQKVIFVPGNWETKADAEAISKKYNIKNLDNNYLIYKNVGIFGVGNADWALYPDEEKTFKHLKEQHEKIKNLEKKIMVSHSHASGTKSELSGIPGDEAIRKAIDKFQPDLFLAGHIHELEGVEEKIGKTKVVNVGKKGRIFEI
ncbi:MAG: metallophosphoesterase family protein [archaeon]|nr:metallophosphoesterase family protein [archaeon]